MYKISIDERGSYLLVTVDGELDPDADVEIDARIRRECELRNIGLALIDIRSLSKRLSGFENHLAAKTFRQRLGSSIRAVAIVDVEEFDEQSQTFELTAVNRGARIKFFNDLETAESWLREAGH